MQQIPTHQWINPLQPILIGVGGFGCGVFRAQELSRYSQASMLAIDKHIDASILNDPIQKLDLRAADSAFRYDMISASKDALRILPEVEQAAQAKDLVILFAGFGGGVGSGVLPVIAGRLRQLGKIIISYVVMPDERISGRKQLLTAQIALNELHPVSNCLIVGSHPPTDISLNYRRVSRNLETILDVCCASSVIPVHYSALMNVIVHKGILAISTARQRGPDRAGIIARELISEPGIAQNMNAPCSLILHLKTKEPTIHELDEIATWITSQWQAECDLIYGVSNDQEIGDELQAGLIVSKL